MATPKQDQVVFDEVTAAALRVIFKQALEEFLQESGLRDLLTDGGLKGMVETFKGVTLNLNEMNRNEMERKKENGKGPLTAEREESEGNGFLTEATKLSMARAGVDPDLIRFFDAWNGYAKALNNADPKRGGVKGLVSYFQRDSEKFQRRFAQWLKKHPAPAAQPAPNPTNPSTPEREHHSNCVGNFCCDELAEGCPCWCHNGEAETLSSTFEIEDD